MIYKGIRLFAEPFTETTGIWPFRRTINGNVEHVAKIIFPMDQVRMFEHYTYSDRFVSFPDKIWVALYGDNDMILINESFEIFEQLFINRHINPKIHISDSFNNLNLSVPNES